MSYEFTPNSYSRFKYRGKEFQSVTAALCAERNWEKADKFKEMLPSEALEYSETMPEPEDWNWYKEHYKYKITLEKFKQNPLLNEKLKDFDYNLLEDEGDRNIIRLVKQALHNERELNQMTEETQAMLKKLGLK